MNTYAAVNPKVSALSAKLDAKLSKVRGFPCANLSDWLYLLTEKGSVEVGRREACGATDVTMKIHREWVKVVAALRKSGVPVTETPVKHKNGSPTRSGGFGAVGFIQQPPTPPRPQESSRDHRAS